MKVVALQMIWHWKTFRHFSSYIYSKHYRDSGAVDTLIMDSGYYPVTPTSIIIVQGSEKRTHISSGDTPAVKDEEETSSSETQGTLVEETLKSVTPTVKTLAVETLPVEVLQKDTSSRNTLVKETHNLWRHSAVDIIHQWRHCSSSDTLVSNSISEECPAVAVAR